MLTAREKQILALVVEEHSSENIARTLSLSVRTIETHRRNICRKLHTSNPIRITKMAIQMGLLPHYSYQRVT